MRSNQPGQNGAMPGQLHGNPGQGGNSWASRFRFDHVKVLIVCRGPIRLEAIQTFERMGTQPCGILLSEKDSVVYPRALSPELRAVGRNERVHRIPDYAGNNAGEKSQRIARIVSLARENQYTHVFAGYGFMAEDHELIAAIEAAGLGFIGPSSGVVRQAGSKDAAKTLARKIGVSVTPGIDTIEALALLSVSSRQFNSGGAPDPLAGLTALANQHGLENPAQQQSLENPAQQQSLEDPARDEAGNGGASRTEEAEEAAEKLLEAARAKKVELVTLADLQAETTARVEALLAEQPGRRLRFKHVGGGGGKGQRIVSSVEEVPAAVSEVLAEARATGPGDNRNFLIEANIEATRHNEIQLLGNGRWCIALGGRDCSLQMHEQKLLEVSISTELLETEAQASQAQGRETRAGVLRADLEVLRTMEEQAERFGEAVGLDSASTFESIVDGENHYFMEVNTRIQVEHRVTELIYGLRFRNPEGSEDLGSGELGSGELGSRESGAIASDTGDFLEIESLVEAMLWVAIHGGELPRPERYLRHASGAEARINATNDALKPHAGGIVLDWSPPGEFELRDDQGIGIRNPDTGAFMTYHLAGAYDSNVALVVTHGEDREDNFRRLAEILRVTDLRGHDLMTNMEFHYGLLHWMLGADAMVKPNTQFVAAYLAGVGALKEAGAGLDLDLAWDALMSRQAGQGISAARALETKRTLILRPLRRLYRFPHLLAGWLAPRARRRFQLEAGRVVWHRNPLEVLDMLYRYLRLEDHPGVTPEERIWTHDQALLDAGLGFYQGLRERLGEEAPSTWKDLSARLGDPQVPDGFQPEIWEDVRAAHRGHQAGLELLQLPLLTGEEAGFYGIQCGENLEVTLPAEFTGEATAPRLRQALEEAPAAHSNQVVAFTGGTFYARPSPEEPPYAVAGQHVEAGDVLGLLEVMKMFNPVRAPFAGKVVMAQAPSEGGFLVQKGLLLFELEPDVPIVHESQEERLQRRQAKTRELMGRV